MRNPFRTIKDGQRILHEHGFYGTEALRIFFDMFYCRKKFHCTINEYFNYKFYNYKNRMRKDYLLRYHQRVSYSFVDGGSASIVGKEQQYKTFHDKIQREWMKVTPDNLSEIESFIKKHGRVIFKPNFGSQGTGIFAFSADDIASQLPEKLSAIMNEDYVCEQYVVQHPKMSEINPGSVNTIRIITLCDGESVKLISAGLRTGAAEGVCDNMSIGGVGAAIYMETGIVFTTGVNYEKTRYFYHPVSGTKIPGFEIPFWNEVKEMIRECALRVNKVAIVGWDIAVTADGPCLIEANNRPAGKLFQISTNQPQGEEILTYIKKNKHKYYKKTPEHIKVRMKRYG